LIKQIKHITHVYTHQEMKYIFFILLSNLLHTFALKMQSEPNFCKNCKFFIKPGFLVGDKFGKCQIFCKKEDDYYLVDGRGENRDEYYYCSVARNSDRMCGPEGKKYVDKNYEDDDKWLS